MPKLSLLLWDVGGVLLTDGWDHRSRAEAVAHFGLDGPEFERRHAGAELEFETGRLDWEGYLDATVFYEPRPFSREEFRAYMLAQSQPHPAAIATARALREGGQYRMAVLNNESRELNEYRIRTFGLAPIFDDFFSSCYTGQRKPDAAAFRLALSVTQHAPDESLFLDDRAENVEAAAQLGLRTLRVEDPGRLRESLAHVGVSAG
ncbi:MAG TPA: HAD family phosphatase [Thermoplasmata archaeon]|nr:HAD family phosphatase [Thermoplasmata archaeon]